MLNMKLTGCYKADFRRSETNLWVEAVQAHRLRKPNSGEAVMFVSHGGNLVLFVLGVHLVAGFGRQRTVKQMTDTRLLRLPQGATWSPLMIQNWANLAGIRLHGVNGRPLQRFEELFPKRKDQRWVLQLSRKAA